MAFVYMLQGKSGRFYIGASENLVMRIEQHNLGKVYSSKRLGLPLKLVASRRFDSMSEALKVERMLKKWKSPSKSRKYLENAG